MKIKFTVCFRPLTVETDDHAAIIADDNSHLHSNLSVLSNHRTDPLSDKEYLQSRDFKSVSVEASTQWQKQRGFHKNVYPLIPRSRSHQDSIKTSKNLVCDGNSISSQLSDAKLRRSSSFNKSLSQLKSMVHERQTFSEAKPKSWNMVLYVFTMSLCVTIFCGRVRAILFTSIILFYLISRRTCTEKRSESVPKFPEIRKDNKKRVIMEGLLKRSHLRGSHSKRG